MSASENSRDLPLIPHSMTKNFKLIIVVGWNAGNFEIIGLIADTRIQKAACNLRHNIIERTVSVHCDVDNTRGLLNLYCLNFLSHVLHLQHIL